MELLVATAIGAITAAGVYLILRLRTFAVVLGMTMLTYAINAFLFVTGRLVVNMPPILSSHDNISPADYTDPLPQALVLTAIVISFGMTAVVVMMSLGAFIEGGDDRVNMPESDRIMPPLKTVDETANEDEKA
ncbi:MAG: Na+/H+ antiporter subunit C [Paracoccus sp. (in: a-proteobacteria)]|jgi:multicomponent K+:H+ antiporter subunit C|uniref:Na+/H+ antiporter subunit C n=1 Tax=unclassified Paracoccus (in: a-proteobacteria) TaxID=2688777 RepID=UPI000C577C63|nr:MULTISPECIES: Na+/H+ antiporter subunit C [unclassified Paracoccus (in: a-proteobacteria)]MAN57662.1 Na+/H+ antiporter subunit C [Paracoccus sp. (in: a-proteobacteria)]MBA48621.1 Na+/H+ antiporter subunit C [Paracoccus sp. (in: a-proteobacteria)]MCS5603881.1 Na+/H+ antiporter subunit C [Paracoccus sp. (in: a-proteobacteria)]MDB2552033.1 Na+/H+ antiporter subunit C [Paracoccus sp. (in: a-proteobacteria)]|tara:strand:+ start:298 stop:696 length:399 start_codon:yes stop_codon:yes gene_type:complete